MKLAEIIGLFREGKATVKSHMKILLEMALVDSHFDQRESELLDKLAKKYGVSEKELERIKKDSSNVELEFTYFNRFRSRSRRILSLPSFLMVLRIFWKAEIALKEEESESGVDISIFRNSFSGPKYSFLSSLKGFIGSETPTSPLE